MSMTDQSKIETLAASQYGKEKQYWLNKLSGIVEKNHFPYDNNIDHSEREDQLNISSGRQFRSVHFEFSDELSAKIDNLVKHYDHRLHMVLIAGLTALLGKYTNHKDITVGSPIYKQEIHGNFINTILTLRNQIQPNMSFRGLISHVRQTVTEAVDNQNYPFETLLYHLGYSTTGEMCPLFDTVLLLNSIHDEEYLQDINVNMTFLFSRSSDRIICQVNYNPAKFKSTTVERITLHFHQLMEGCFFDLEKNISDVQVISEEERKRILNVFNDTRRSYPSEKSIDLLFEDQVQRIPNQIAVTSGDISLTYKNLDDLSNRLAGYIQSLGNTKDSIGIISQNTVYVIVAILGILKSGNAYLPINIDYPDERKEFLLADYGISVICTDCIVVVEEKIKKQVSNIIDLYNLHRFPDNNRGQRQHSSRDLAYIMYTSGSTGTPKGVMVEHMNVVRLVKNTNFIEFKDDDRILQTGVLDFDASTFEIWGALLNGLSVFLTSREILLNNENLKQALHRYQITTIWMTSPLFNQMLDADVEIFKFLRNLLVGGDVLSPSHINRLQKSYPWVNIINGYGPTENTTFSTTHQVKNIYRDNIPIGKPIHNSTAYIFDYDGNVTPVGGIGELWVGGDGVARGYLNRPELTAERFHTKHGLSTMEEPVKLYKTGDLARWLPEGIIEFLGRIDQQVKIRGFRIEPEEIENHLIALDNIKEAVVTDRQTNEGEKYLCAYVVPNNGTYLDSTELRSTLLSFLPDYMVPAYIVTMEQLPLTANKKIDKRALPDPKTMVTGKDHVAPRNPLEDQLVTIWSEILGIKEETIGIDHDFFELGGHSLKVTILISKIHKKLNVKVPIIEVFNSPTIRELAQCIKSLKKDSFSAIQPAAKKPFYRVSSAQKRLYILQRMQPDMTSYNVPFVKQVEGQFDIDKLEKAFQKLIQRHESLRTRFIVIDNNPVQEIQQEVDFNIEFIETGKNEAKDTVRDLIRPFDLSQAPLIRVAVIKGEENVYLLVVDLHHIITDGTSMEILVKDFSALYEEQALPPLRLHYKDFSEWQNYSFESGAVKEQAEYWINQFQGEIPILNLPVDFIRPAYQNYDGNRRSFRIDKEKTANLKQIASKHNATLFMVLLAAFNILLAKLSGQEDIIVGSPIAGRRHDDLKDIIGMFVNTIALRNFPSADKTVSDFLVQLRSKTLEAFENQDYQFEELVEHISVHRDVSRNPLFDVMFVLQNLNIPDVKLKGAKLKSHQHKNLVSKFDLTLSVVEARGELALTFEYMTSVFKTDTVRRFIKYYEAIIDAIIVNPTIKISSIEIISDEERKLIIEQFNDTDIPETALSSIHEQFEMRVDQTPDKIALIETDGENKASYQELNHRSNKLARTLRQKGVTIDTIVGIMIPRSIEMMVGIMAILKAGGSYLPIDPTFPVHRVGFMIQDSSMSLILSKGIPHDLTFNDVDVIDIDNQKMYDQDDSNLEFKFSKQSNHLAYVIYTSGSTGKPKGVMVPHRGVVNTLVQLESLYPLGPNDNYLLKTNYMFDVSVSELFGWFFGQGTLIIPAPGIEKDPESLTRLIDRYRITHINFVPSMLNLFLDSLDSSSTAKLSSLKFIIVAGEAFTSTLAKKIRTYLSNSSIAIENIFGPTEASIYTTRFSLTIDHSGMVPIGKPMGNIKNYILDYDGQLLPIHLTGELCIGGIGLARGYLNRPALTAQMFKPNPFAVGEMIYHTGDAARWLPDGNIQYIGRLDQQMKIRGFRIEPGEIENRLLDHDDISEAVVVAWSSSTGDTSLCAYFVPTEGNPPPGLSQLRSHLKKELPDYMIPAHFIKMEHIPRLPSGKIDRKKLRESGEFLATGKKHVSPRTQIEAQVAAVWQEVLNIEKISIHDDFFEIGGNSFKAVQIVMALMRDFEITITHLFRHRTIADLSENITWKKENMKIKIQELRSTFKLQEKQNPFSNEREKIKQDYELYKEKIKKEKNISLKSSGKKYKNILLTGATGYLGTYLMKQFLETTNARLYLLLRTGLNPQSSPLERLKEMSDFYLGTNALNPYLKRIEILTGDIVLPRCGLSSELYETLAKSIDAIVHAAADVRHFGVYDEFHKTNVIGTSELLEFARYGKKKDFHHISTISVGNGPIPERDHLLFTEFLLDVGQKPTNVYVKSKLEAEKQVHLFREKGLNTFIYRMGNLVFHSETGTFQKNINDNAFYANMKAFISLGAVTDAYSLGDLTFIDWAAKAVGMLVYTVKTPNQIFHLQSPYKLSWREMDIYLERAGIKVQIVNSAQFLDYLLARINDSNSQQVRSVERFLLHSGLMEKENKKRTISTAVSDRTRQILKKAGFEWPRLEDIHVERMIDYCNKIGFIN